MFAGKLRNFGLGIGLVSALAASGSCLQQAILSAQRESKPEPRSSTKRHPMPTPDIGDVFHIRYRRNNGNYVFLPYDGKDLQPVTRKLTSEIQESLKNRPLILQRLQLQPGGIQMLINRADYFYTDEGQQDTGYAKWHYDDSNNITPGSMRIEYATGGLTESEDQTLHFDLPMHELTHVLDGIASLYSDENRQDNYDGLFPDMTTKQNEAFIKAREKAKQWLTDTRFSADWTPEDIEASIEIGEASPLYRLTGDNYHAIDNDEEFLAVLTEAYFRQREALQKYEPELFDYADRFFQYWRGPSDNPIDNSRQETVTKHWTVRTEKDGSIVKAGLWGTVGLVSILLPCGALSFYLVRSRKKGEFEVEGPFQE